MNSKKVFTQTQSPSLKENAGLALTINEIREKEFSGESLTKEERLALTNYDKFRISELNKEQSDMEFHARYRELQVMSNLGDFREFLKEKYSNL